MWTWGRWGGHGGYGAIFPFQTIQKFPIVLGLDILGVRTRAVESESLKVGKSIKIGKIGTMGIQLLLDFLKSDSTALIKNILFLDDFRCYLLGGTQSQEAQNNIGEFILARFEAFRLD